MKFQFYKQLDDMDCGPSCLRMIAKHYGKTFSVQQIRDMAYIIKTGVNLLGLSDAAEAIGFHSLGVRTTISKLKEQVKRPCIIWELQYYIIILEIRCTMKDF